MQNRVFIVLRNDIFIIGRDGQTSKDVLYIRKGNNIQIKMHHNLCKNT